MTAIISAQIPDDINKLIIAYAKRHRVSKSHVAREIIIGQMTIIKIKEEVDNGE